MTELCKEVIFLSNRYEDLDMKMDAVIGETVQTSKEVASVKGAMKVLVPVVCAILGTIIYFGSNGVL